MGTLHQKVAVSGYCPVDRGDVPIHIGYISFPMPNESKKNMTFVKVKNNYCHYLHERKCSLAPEECPIWKSAADEIHLDVSDKRW